MRKLGTKRVVDCQQVWNSNTESYLQGRDNLGSHDSCPEGPANTDLTGASVPADEDDERSVTNGKPFICLSAE